MTRSRILLAFTLLTAFAGDCDDCGSVGGPVTGGSCTTDAACPAGTYCRAGACALQSEPYLYLTDRVAKKLSFEIDAVEGFAPNADSLNDFLGRLNELKASNHLRKPDGIRILMDDTLPKHAEPDHAYTFAEVNSLFSAHQDMHSSGSEAVATFIYLDGHYVDQNVLGFAYRGDRIAIFAKTIRDYCSGQLFSATVCRLAESDVLIHEFGHLLGLVNNGINMTADHQDDQHGAHDKSDQCIMYWTIETASGIDAIVSQVVGGNSGLKPFDSACLDDMMAAQAAP